MNPPPSPLPRIWIVEQHTLPPGYPGGTRHFHIGEELIAQGFDVEIMTSDFHISKRKHLKLRWPQLKQSESFGDLRWTWLWASGYQRNNWRRYTNILTFTGTLALTTMLRRKPDVIIGSSPHLLAAYAAYLMAKLRRVPFYIEIRDLWPQTLIDMGGKSESSRMVRLLAWLERKLYTHADRVLLLAEEAVDYVVARGAKRENILWVPNGVELFPLATLPTPSVARKEHRIEQDRFVLMYTGAHGAANSLATTVEAARFLDHEAPGKFRILLVGDGIEKANLLQQGVGIECLEFREPIPKRDLRTLLHAADALILTLLDVPVFHYGVSPRKLYDYYAAGKPVVVNVEGQITREVTNHACGFCALPENPRSLADAILKMAALSPAARAAMGKQSRALAASTYDMQVIAQRIAKVARLDLMKN